MRVFAGATCQTASIAASPLIHQAPLPPSRAHTPASRFGTLTIQNDTHAAWNFVRAADGVVTDSFVLSRERSGR